MRQGKMLCHIELLGSERDLTGALGSCLAAGFRMTDGRLAAAAGLCIDRANPEASLKEQNGKNGDQAFHYPIKYQSLSVGSMRINFDVGLKSVRVPTVNQIKKGRFMSGKTILIVVVVALVLGAGWFIKARNRFVALDENVKQSWSQVENVYQRRLDLIPNLVATVQGYASHERETLIAVTEARAKVGQVSSGGLGKIVNDPQAFSRFQEAQGALSSALSRLMVVAEKYPDLKANENFLDLQRQLEGTENRIAVERRRFSEAAQEYNTSIRYFPGSLIASLGGFQPKNYFQADVGAEHAPKVNFATPAPATP